MIVVERTDLDMKTDASARELADAENRVPEVDMSLDLEQIAEDQEVGVNLDTMFLLGEGDAILEGLPEVDTDGIVRVAPDYGTARTSLFLHCGENKVPVTQECDRLAVVLKAYWEENGTYYGFMGSQRRSRPERPFGVRSGSGQSSIDGVTLCACTKRAWPSVKT